MASRSDDLVRKLETAQGAALTAAIHEADGMIQDQTTEGHARIWDALTRRLALLDPDLADGLSALDAQDTGSFFRSDAARPWGPSRDVTHLRRQIELVRQSIGRVAVATPAPPVRPRGFAGEAFPTASRPVFLPPDVATAWQPLAPPRGALPLARGSASFVDRARLAPPVRADRTPSVPVR